VAASTGPARRVTRPMDSREESGEVTAHDKEDMILIQRRTKDHLRSSPPNMFQESPWQRNTGTTTLTAAVHNPDGSNMWNCPRDKT